MGSNRGKRSEGGFTLIEIAIALVVIGLLITPMLMLVNAKFHSQRMLDTRAKFSNMESALTEYVRRNGRYPRPASLTAYEGDADYGIEFAVGTAPAECPDVEANGLCVTEDTGTLAPFSDSVIIGAIPFNTLKIPPEDTLDSWGNRIIYAVTDYKTDAATYVRDGQGTLRFSALDDFNKDVIPELINEGGGHSYTRYDMILVSTGPTGKGGYTANGQLIGICVEDPANPENEDENCDFDAFFMLDENRRTDTRLQADGGTRIREADLLDPLVPGNGTRNVIEGPRFYDDLTHDIQSVSFNLDWVENTAVPEYRTEYVVTEAKRFSIGLNTPPEYAVHVAGDIRASEKSDPADPLNPLTEGRLFAPEICSTSPDLCIAPGMIANTPADTSAAAASDMNCYGKVGTSLSPAIGVSESRILCGSTVLSDGTTSSYVQGTNENIFIFPATAVGVNTICGTGSLMAGMINGVPECTLPP